MNHAIIDIGSNSMRLTIYRISGQNFKILLKDKYMSALAGYVKDGKLTEEGMQRACDGLLVFRSTLESLEIPNVSVYATASLRNIDNTQEAVDYIRRNTGYDVEILSNVEEALYGYFGMMQELNADDGVYVDIGGASTELVTVKHARILNSNSYEMGSLKLYVKCVSKILPSRGELKTMEETIREAIPQTVFSDGPMTKLLCTGGTARAVLKVARKLFGYEWSQNRITADQFRATGKALMGTRREASDLILKTEPERIHTLIPGYLILSYLAEGYGAKEIIIGKYGVREGYLCQRILKK